MLAHVRGLRTPHRTTHEPPSKALGVDSESMGQSIADLHQRFGVLGVGGEVVEFQTCGLLGLKAGCWGMVGRVSYGATSPHFYIPVKIMMFDILLAGNCKGGKADSMRWGSLDSWESFGRHSHHLHSTNAVQRSSSGRSSCLASSG